MFLSLPDSTLTSKGSVLKVSFGPKHIHNDSKQLNLRTPLFPKEYAFFKLLMFSTATTHEMLLGVEIVTFSQGFLLHKLTFSSQNDPFLISVKFYKVFINFWTLVLGVFSLTLLVSFGTLGLEPFLLF